MSLYHIPLEKWASLGVLKLRTAFSRDQAKKVYVQHLIAEDGGMLWKMMEVSCLSVCLSCMQLLS